MPKKPVDACLNCRSRHIKCDETTPKCRRCETKGLECTRSKGIFRQGSAARYDANFGRDQQWVNTGSMQLQFDVRGVDDHPTKDNSEQVQISTASEPSLPEDSGLEENDVMTPDDQARPSKRIRAYRGSDNECGSASANETLRYAPAMEPSHIGVQQSIDSQSVSTPTRGVEQSDLLFSHSWSDSYGHTPPTVSPATNFNDGTISTPMLSSNNALVPLSDLLEASLLRYYIEELAQLFDTNDDRRLFQLLVPKRALQCPPLLHAICAVSARRLAAHPYYRTPEGIYYQGNHLPTLDSTTAVEYMLKCIPFLFDFHNASEEVYQENIIAAAVILRQYEEMDNEAEATEDIRTPEINVIEQRANFLAVTQGIIDTCASFPTFAHETLAHAAFWIAVRQEVYESFMREEAPKMTFDKYHFGPVSTANRLVMHAAEVTRWNWGSKTDEEWIRLNAKQQQFTQAYASDLIPIYHRPADPTKNEGFPSVWYASDAQIVSVQHFELARMILIAEKPSSHTSIATSAVTRATQRKTEALVRGIILKLCGIAFSNPVCKPALVSATMAISLYGDYFTDERERGCLLRVFEKMEEARVWPVQRKRRELMQKWKVVDSL